MSLEGLEIRGNKTLNDLGREAGSFVLHTALAAIVVALVIGGMTLQHPDPESAMPKLICTALSLFVPMVAGFIINRFMKNEIAQYIWISGLVFFSLVCVWVLDLPTGNGLCNDCGAVDKLWRTFFSIDHGSGLMAGDGLLIGTWIPLSMIGYAIGAKLGFGHEE